MNPIPRPITFTGMPYDVLNVIVQRLPASASKMPWRDLNSLASSCKFLSQWKAESVTPRIHKVWREAREIVKSEKSWRTGLEMVVGGFMDPADRLFREPILRKLGAERRDREEGKQGSTYSGFVALMSKHRETISLAELQHFLAVCELSSPNEKQQIFEALPELLQGLGFDELRLACKHLAEFLGRHRELCHVLVESCVVEKLLDSVGRSKSAFAVLELGLLARGLLPYPMSDVDLRATLSVVNGKHRWRWLEQWVPKFYRSSAIVRQLLINSSCRTEMIRYMQKRFFEHNSTRNKLAASHLIYKEWSILASMPEGRSLLEQVSLWISNSNVFNRKGNLVLKNKLGIIMSLHTKPLLRYISKEQRGELAKLMGQAIEHTVAVRKRKLAVKMLSALSISPSSKLLKNLKGDATQLTPVFRDAFREVAYFAGFENRFIACDRLKDLAAASLLGKDNILLLKDEARVAVRGIATTAEVVRHVRDYDSAFED